MRIAVFTKADFLPARVMQWKRLSARPGRTGGNPISFRFSELGTVQVAVRMTGGGRGNIVFTGSGNSLHPGGSTPSGEGTASLIDEALTCQKGSCNGECKLAVTIGIKPKVYSTKEGR